MKHTATEDRSRSSSRHARPAARNPCATVSAQPKPAIPSSGHPSPGARVRLPVRASIGAGGRLRGLSVAAAGGRLPGLSCWPRLRFWHRPPWPWPDELAPHAWRGAAAAPRPPAAVPWKLLSANFPFSIRMLFWRARLPRPWPRAGRWLAIRRGGGCWPGPSRHEQHHAPAWRRPSPRAATGIGLPRPASGPAGAAGEAPLVGFTRRCWSAALLRSLLAS